ncbi:MAG: UDP-N-acetylmuramoyl-tripeptide--D-alanyl-D-alanine ligase [Candidatus Omnitrophica bacterium]|nr:UDP-N-acetylmuramoyl-tripeptide--D-alanyl-D-alanine ligase [Candidatus Omnitrophota bacterium]
MRENVQMFTVAEVVSFVAGRLAQGNPQAPLAGVSTDTRTLAPGELFVALPGEQFDGHGFISQAARGHAGAVLVSAAWAGAHPATLAELPLPVIVAADTIAALGNLAAGHRRRFSLPVIAITGSCGKTTTKEMAAAVLSGRLCVLKSEKSFNNHIGVPLTLLRLRPEHQAAVLELGMNHAGEIRHLARMAAPTMAVITMVGQAHREAFQDERGILAAKCELLEELSPAQPAMINGDCPELRRQVCRYPLSLTFFGIESDCQVRARDISIGWRQTSFAVAGGGNFTVPLPGRHNVYNALAAIAVARTLGVPDAVIRERLTAAPPSPGRMERRQLNRREFLADCYNANPDSMAAALRTLSDIRGRRRAFAVLGDMLELGAAGEQAHRQVGALAASLSLEGLFTVGERARDIGAGASAAGMPSERVRHCRSLADAAAAVRECSQAGDVILLKASRRMKLETIMDLLQPWTQ